MKGYTSLEAAHQRDIIFKDKMLTYKPNSLVALKKFTVIYNCVLTKENENWGEQGD